MADHDARTRAYDFGRPDDDGDAITDEQPTTAMPRTRAMPSTSRASSSSLYEGSDESTRVIPQQAPPPAPDKKAIAAALKAGTPVPGAHAEQRVRLEIH